MDSSTENSGRKTLGKVIGIITVLAMLVALALVIFETDRHPRTDDASVRANFIEIAPEVSGRLVQLPVKDNQYVKQGAVLFVIDPRPYEYALQQALSDQEALEQQIVDAKAAHRCPAQRRRCSRSRRPQLEDRHQNRRQRYRPRQGRGDSRTGGRRSRPGPTQARHQQPAPHRAAY